MPRQSFTVVSYNIQARPLLDDCAWKSPLIGERLRPYDLAGVQESFHRSRMLFDQNALHTVVHFARRRHPAKLVGSGLAVLSRFPVTGAEAEYFEDEGSLENRVGTLCRQPGEILRTEPNHLPGRKNPCPRRR